MFYWFNYWLYASFWFIVGVLFTYLYFQYIKIKQSKNN